MGYGLWATGCMPGWSPPVLPETGACRCVRSLDRFASDGRQRSDVPARGAACGASLGHSVFRAAGRTVGGQARAEPISQSANQPISQSAVLQCGDVAPAPR
eukprot:9478680-Pyramimonas_sp.AAC.2